MLKKLLMLCVALVLSFSASFVAAVEVNTADQATLESVKGIGPAHAKAIIDERTKNGPFKDADDLATRVKGIGNKSVVNLEAAGLTINGSTASPSGAKAAAPAAAKPVSKSAAPAATTTMAPASAPETASSTKKSKKSKAVPAASAPATAAAVPASEPANASDAKTSKKSKKAKAASAASGT
jgi:competence protein ComEA